jgi:hemolysin activation/secretion protein
LLADLQETTEPDEMLILQPRPAARAAIFAALALLLMNVEAWAQSGAPASPSSPPAARQRTFDINEFRIEGSTQLTVVEVEKAVYPFLGPARVLEDVERARAALEKVYTDKGYQSVSVVIPQQTVRNGVVTLKVNEAVVGRLRVRGSRFFSPLDVKSQAPSMAEGKVPKFDEIAQDIVVLNQIPDRRVTPAMRVGERPGTIDVDLNVEDTLPLHGSLELNNRHSRYTTPLRLAGALRYDNLWQLGHSIGVSYQVAPSRPQDSKVFTASYLARFPNLYWLTLSANYLKQNSDVSTVGGVNVAGPGEMAGGRASFTLPGTSGLFHAVTTGFDYKRFGQQVRLEGAVVNSTPITTWPILVQYNAVISSRASETLLTIGATFNLRTVSSSPTRFDERRFHSLGDFIYYRGELSRTNELPGGLQFFGRLQAQYSAEPLPSAEQFSAGGLDSVRGYYESDAIGDYGASGTVELRTPSLAKLFGNFMNEWRLYAFFDGGWLGVKDPLPEQQSRFKLWSTGGGTRLKLFGQLNGELDVAIPLRTEGFTTQRHPVIHFRVLEAF